MRKLLLYVLFLCSGAAGLIYELVWVRELIFVFGGTTYAITTVLVAFMGGLGLGCFLSGKLSHRLRRPGRLYGIVEIGIGIYALLVPLLLNVAEPVYRALYAQTASTPLLLNLVRFGVGALVLIIPTTLMGATLPILVRYVTLQGGALGRSVGQLYGINTLGAVVGTVGAGFVLIPALGLLHTTWLAAGLNIGIGIMAVLLLGQAGALGAAPGAASAAARPSAAGGTAGSAAGGTVRSGAAASGRGGMRESPAPRGPRAAEEGVSPHLRLALLVGFAISGFAAMVYQITWSRALVLSLGSTTYSFTCILAAFILGLALGSLAVARWVDRWRNPALVFGVLEILIGLVAVVIVPIHGRVPLIVRELVSSQFQDYGKLMASQILVVIAVTIVPTLLMGAIFPLVTRALAATGDDAGAATGRAYAVNTLGTITGSFLAGFVLIRSDVLGVQNSIIFASVLNGLVGWTLVLLAGQRVPAPPAAVRHHPPPPPARKPHAVFATLLLLAIPVVALAAGRWDREKLTAAPFLNRPTVPQRTLAFYKEGVDLTVTVEHPPDQAKALTLTVNGKPDASTSIEDMTTQLLLGHLPALLADGARTACVIGLGSGITTGALLRHPAIERVDCVEISSEVIEAAAWFAEFSGDVLHDPRVKMIRADGRNHLLLSADRYDLIVSEPSNPWISGVSNLFTLEFFALARARLTERGVLGVWLHGYKMSLDDFRMIVRTLFAVFPHVSLWELHDHDYLLVASDRPMRVDLPQFERRLADPPVRADLHRAGLRRVSHILGRYMSADEPLRQWVAGAPLNTDDNARLEFSAPRHMFDTERAVAQALMTVQRRALDDLVAEPPADPTLASEIEGFVGGRRARNQSKALAQRGEFAPALRQLIEAYQRSPEDVLLYRYLIVSARVVDDSGLSREPDIAPLIAQISRLRPILPAPAGALTLAAVAEYYRSSGLLAIDHGQLPAAVALLDDAWTLAPDRVDIVRDLADVLLRLERADDARAVLNAFLRDHPMQAPELEADARFRALLENQPPAP